MTMGFLEKKKGMEFSQLDKKDSTTDEGHYKGPDWQAMPGSNAFKGSRMDKSFSRIEHQPLYTHHKGEPSGCMED
jgi:hypothetical protein